MKKLTYIRCEDSNIFFEADDGEIYFFFFDHSPDAQDYEHYPNADEFAKDWFDFYYEFTISQALNCCPDIEDKERLIEDISRIADNHYYCVIDVDHIYSNKCGEWIEHGAYIKELRETYYLTQVSLSNTVGIPIRTIQDWESGRRNPPDYVIKLIDFYLKNKKEADLIVSL